MGFRTGSYAKVWKVTDKGNYSEVELSVSKKINRQNNMKLILVVNLFVLLELLIKKLES